MLKVPVIKGNLNKALKIFKKKFKSTGVIKEIRERQQYTKKSKKRKLIKDKAIHKQKYLNNLEDEQRTTWIKGRYKPNYSYKL